MPVLLLVLSPRIHERGKEGETTKGLYFEVNGIGKVMYITREQGTSDEARALLHMLCETVKNNFVRHCSLSDYD